MLNKFNVIAVLAVLVILGGLHISTKSQNETKEQLDLIVPDIETEVINRTPQATLTVQIVAIEGVKDKVKMIVFLGTCIKTKVITLKELSSKETLNKILYDLIDKEMASGECEKA